MAQETRSWGYDRIAGALYCVLTMAEPMRTRIQQRAQHACEYCRLPQRASLLPHQMDPVIAQQHLGSDKESHLCLCCLRCNLKKGPHIASTDPEAGDVSRIVAVCPPRKQRWHAHLQRRDDGRIEGVTPAGRYNTALGFPRGGMRAVAQTADAAGLETMNVREFPAFELFDHAPSAL